MAVRLIDPDAETKVVISGTVFSIRQLQQGDAIKLSRFMRQFLDDGDESARSGIHDILTRVVVSIDHDAMRTLSKPDFLAQLCLEDFALLAVEIGNLSTLNAIDTKNLGG